MNIFFSSRTYITQQETLETYWILRRQLKAYWALWKRVLILGFWLVIASVVNIIIFAFDGEFTLSDTGWILGTGSVLCYTVFAALTPKREVRRQIAKGTIMTEAPRCTRFDFYEQHLVIHAAISGKDVPVNYSDISAIIETKHYYIAFFCNTADEQCFTLEKSGFQGISHEEAYKFLLSKSGKA